MFVSCQISDGLGNRLFQIAAMLGYAEKHGHKPLFITEWINENKTQPGGNKVCALFPGIPTMSLESVAGSWSLIQPPGVDAMTYRELPYVAGHVKLQGYFQSELYFPLRLPISGLVPVVRENALFLHVRRGDYLHPLNQHHHVDLRSYYEKALALFPDNASVLVCSDDIAWCKVTLPLRYTSVRADKWIWIQGDEFETLSAMMGCGLGGICANSTFSWWGSYLNPSVEKLVVMPATWMHSRTCDPVPTDLYPKGVLRI